MEDVSKQLIAKSLARHDAKEVDNIRISLEAVETNTKATEKIDDKLTKHILAQNISDKQRAEFEKQMKPLADLVPTLEEMVKNQEAVTRASKWVVRFVGFLGLVIGIIYTLFKILDIR